MNIHQCQEEAERLLHAAGILPVVTVDSTDQARRIATALLQGGLHSIELTLRTPAALDALAALKRELPQIVIGAGTVLDPEQAQRARDAGADFLVSPGTPAPLADALATLPMPVVPGAATPSELMALSARGFRVCKLFPASAVGGIAMLKALAGPLPGLRLCPTGGIGEAEAGHYLARPNVVCIGGSWMVPKDWIEAGDFARIEASAASAAAIVRQVRGAAPA